MNNIEIRERPLFVAILHISKTHKISWFRNTSENRNSLYKRVVNCNDMKLIYK